MVIGLESFLIGMFLFNEKDGIKYIRISLSHIVLMSENEIGTLKKIKSFYPPINSRCFEL